jgi:hypothetical protein
MTRLSDAFDVLVDRGEPVGADALFAGARDAIADSTVAELQPAAFAPRSWFRIVAVAGVCVSVVVATAVVLSTRGTPTPTAHTVTQRTTPTRSGYFQVAQVIGRTSSSGRCHTLPTTLACLTLGAILGDTQDLVDSGKPYRNSSGDWTIAIRMSPRLANNLNRNLHRQLAFIIDGTVPDIVVFTVPISAPEFAINVGPQHAAAVTLADTLQHLRHP